MFELDTEINYVFTLPLEFIGGRDGMVVEKKMECNMQMYIKYRKYKFRYLTSETNLYSGLFPLCS